MLVSPSRNVRDLPFGRTRSLLNLAKENKLTESFLWIPSLEGPTFDSPPTEMMSWLKDWSGEKWGVGQERAYAAQELASDLSARCSFTSCRGKSLESETDTTCATLQYPRPLFPFAF